MSTIDPTSQSQLDSILKKLGVQQEKKMSLVATKTRWDRVIF